MEVVLQAAEDKFDANTEIVHLSEYDIIPADGRKLSEYSGDTAKALELIINSNAFIIGVTVYRG